MKFIPLLLAGVLTAVAASAESLSVSNADELNQLKREVNDAYTAYYVSTNDEGGKLYATWRQLEVTNFPQILSLAGKAPESQLACDIFLWIALKAEANRGSLFTNRLQALDYLVRYHSTSSNVGPLCSYLGHFWAWQWRGKQVADFLNSVAKNNPERANRAQAIYGLGCLYAVKSEELADFEIWGKVPFYAENLTTNDWVELSKYGTSQQAAADAERQFQKVIANYSDCLDLRERPNPKEAAPSLKKLAEENMFALQHLSLGKTAPEIETDGVDGRRFKLSESRGKICLLSFWASWCGPCMQMVPVERALTERMQGKPFCIIGVNGDTTLANANRAMQREKMTWPSFWNGSGGPKGPISSAWNVHGWPTIFVLDADGIIRFKLEGYGNGSSNLLNGCVDELMKKAAK